MKRKMRIYKSAVKTVTGDTLLLSWATDCCCESATCIRSRSRIANGDRRIATREFARRDRTDFGLQVLLRPRPRPRQVGSGFLNFDGLTLYLRVSKGRQHACSISDLNICFPEDPGDAETTKAEGDCARSSVGRRAHLDLGHRRRVIPYKREEGEIARQRRRRDLEMTKNSNTQRQWESIGQHESIIVQVLSWLPTIPLLRFKPVCKSWCTLISDPYLIKLHVQRSKARPRILILPLDALKWQREIAFYTYEPCSPRASLLFRTELRELENETMPPPCHCNGLILLSARSQVLVCNPRTKEVITLPNPSSPSFYVGERLGFGFVPSTNEYKVVRCYYRSYNFGAQTCRLGFQIFTLGRGTNNSWRAITRDPPYPIEVSSPPVSMNGYIYWKIDNRLHRSSPKAILSFNLKDEDFNVIPCPPPFIAQPNKDFSLIELEGALWFMDLARTKQVDLWTFKDNCPNPNQAWTKCISISLPSFPYLTSSIRRMTSFPILSPISIHDGKLLLSINNYLHYLDLHNKSWELVSGSLAGLSYENPRKGRSDWESAHFHLITYVESPVPIRP